MHSPILSAETAAAEAADRNQAEHFIHALDEICVEIDRRIAKYQTAIADYQARGSTDDAHRCRVMIREQERERQHLDWMIDALHRRFTWAAGVASR